MILLRPLGNTGLMVSPIGLGMAALGRPGYINLGHGEDLGGEYQLGPMEMHVHTVLDAAWRAGMRYFDAARSYGLGEAFLGNWLVWRGIGADAVTVGSKWGYFYTADWRVDAGVHEVKEHSLSLLRRQWHESRANLARWLRLYQIHSASFESGVLDNKEVLEELARIKGRNYAIGLTLSGANQSEVLERALQIRIDGVRLFDCVQATWNLLEPSVGPALKAARGEGVGVIVKEAVANGRLSPRNRDPSFAVKAAILDREAERQGTTVDAVALGAALAQPWADVVLSGAVTVGQLWSNIRALEVRWDNGVEGLLSELAEDPVDYWETRSRLAWN
jgi:aryl-alcohol dehydrogenase-like predicted oxidoreductase